MDNPIRDFLLIWAAILVISFTFLMPTTNELKKEIDKSNRKLDSLIKVTYVVNKFNHP